MEETAPRASEPNDKTERRDASRVCSLFVDTRDVSYCANNWHGCLRLSRLLTRQGSLPNDRHFAERRRERGLGSFHRNSEGSLLARRSFAARNDVPRNSAITEGNFLSR